MIKAIVFDLGGVLFTDGTSRFIQLIADRYKFRIDEVKKILDGEIGKNYRESKITRDEFWIQMIDRLGLKESADILEKEWINCYELIPQTVEIINKLRGKYKVYFLSGNTKERESRLEEKFGFKSLFDGGVFSYEVGVNKPDPRIYQTFINKVGVKPEEMIFIDDKDSSLPPAKELGMATILFKSPKKLESELIALDLI